MASQKRQASLTGFYAVSNKVQRSETPKGSSEEHRSFMIYCDLDGVLVDFDAGVEKLFKGNKRFKRTSDIPSGLLWSSISKAGEFYSNLPWTKDGKELWRAILPLQPNILTGVPMNKAARGQKAGWCRRELPLGTQNIVINHIDMAGPKKAHQIMNNARRKNLKSSVNDQQYVDVITCWTSNKHVECDLIEQLPSSETKFVLIDDRDKLASQWEKAGGIFVHHTSTEKTLAELRKLKILPCTKDERMDSKSCRQNDTSMVSTKKNSLALDSQPKEPVAEKAAIDLRDSSDDDEVQLIE